MTFTSLTQGPREGGRDIVSASVGTMYRLPVADVVVMGVRNLDQTTHVHCGTNPHIFSNLETAIFLCFEHGAIFVL